MILEIIVSALLVLSGGLALAGAFGLWRLPQIFLRMHAPALASTLGTWSVTLASIIFFTADAGRPTLHVWLIAILLSIAAPVTTVLLARAALFRGRQFGEPLPPPLGGDEAR